MAKVRGEIGGRRRVREVTDSGDDWVRRKDFWQVTRETRFSRIGLSRDTVFRVPVERRTTLRLHVIKVLVSIWHSGRICLYFIRGHVM